MAKCPECGALIDLEEDEVEDRFEELSQERAPHGALEPDADVPAPHGESLWTHKGKRE